MYILNSTYLIDNSIESNFVRAFKEDVFPLLKHINEVNSCNLYKVHTNNESNEISISFQVSFENISNLEVYSKTYSSKIENTLNTIFKQKIPFFQTLLQQY